MNIRCNGMKRLMEQVVARHVEAVHYSTLARILVGWEKGTSKEKDAGFWTVVLDSLAGKKDKTDRVEQRIREVTKWGDPVEEKTSLVEAVCQN